MFEELQNKVAVVTGSAGGIGREISIKLAQQGAILVGIDNDPERGQATKKAVEDIGGKAFFELVDLSSEAEIQRVFKKIGQDVGSVDVLVNSAGVCRPMPLLKTTKAIWDLTISINLTATFLCIQQVVEGMAARGYGKIVNISSRSGVVGSKGFASYSASKFGEIGLTQCAANEFAKDHINVNAICPGIVFTPMWEKQLDDYVALKGYNPDNMQEELVRKIPMERLQTEEDIANAVLFLVSEMSKNITGHTLMVTGGY